MQTHFTGRGAIYAQYRPEPPAALIDFLAQQLGLSQTKKLNRYLDLGCGPGKLTIPLSRYFTTTIGVDPAADMLIEAEKLAKGSQGKNIQWVNDYAENLAAYNWEVFDLITAMNAFHWMDHKHVVTWFLQALARKKHLVLIGSYSLTSPDSDWQKALLTILDRWVGAEKQNILGTSDSTKFCEVLRQYPFTAVTSHEIPEKIIWNIDSLLGCVFTISYCSEEKLGKKATVFREEVKNTLLQLHPDNRFVQHHKISVVIAQK